MRASWFALHASLCRVLNRRSSDSEFQIMRQAYPELAAFGSIASLMEHQHSPGGDRAARFSIIRALVMAAQSGPPYRSTAHLMVIVALWPGLDAVLWRTAQGFPDGREDLPVEVLSRICEAILALNLDRVTSVAATLLRNLERDIRRDLIAARVIGQASLQIDEPAVEASAGATEAPEPIGNRVLADQLSALKPEDANLLRRVVILGETQEVAGHSLGLHPAAARKRFQRALAKLRASQKIPPALSHSGSPAGL